MDTDSGILLIYTDDVYNCISGDVEKWFDTPNYDERRRKRPKTISCRKKNKK